MDYSVEFWFMLNGQLYEYYRDPFTFEPVDFLLTNRIWDHNDTVGGCVRDCLFDRYQFKKKIFVDIFRNFEDQIKFLIDRPGREEDIVITNAYDPTIDIPSYIVFNDAMFNRTKAYYENYPFPDNVWRHHWSHPINYTIPANFDAQNKNKIFVSAGTTNSYMTIQGEVHHRRFRSMLMEFMKNNYGRLGHIGHGDVDINYILLTNQQCPNAVIVDDLEIDRKNLLKERYSPPHNLYYQDSFISIYGESVTYGTSIAPTEKTFDPLIKGHFILPFSCVGLIKYLRERNGFQFPDFIDYSYDCITDDGSRFQAYLDEVKRLLSIDIDTWRQHWNDNLSIIQHNQAVFQQPYHTIDLNRLLES